MTCNCRIKIEGVETIKITKILATVAKTLVQELLESNQNHFGDKRMHVALGL